MGVAFPELCSAWPTQPWVMCLREIHLEPMYILFCLLNSVPHECIIYSRNK